MSTVRSLNSLPDAASGPTLPNEMSDKRLTNEALIDETLAESFPASDPPSWTLGTEPRKRAPRSGFYSVTPRIVLEDVGAFVAFLRAVFDAQGEHHAGRPAEMRIGDSVLMVSESGERDAFPAFLYVYVDDADVTFERAVAAHATTIEAPLDTPYGDRRAMVRDAWGNVWQIAHVI